MGRPPTRPRKPGDLPGHSPSSAPAAEVVPGNATYQYQQAAARLYGGELAFNLHPTALPWLSWRTGAALVIGLNNNPALLERVGSAARYLPLMPAPPGPHRAALHYTP